MSNILNMVAAGIGISVVPACMSSVHAEEVTYCRLDDAPGLRAPITLLHRDDNLNPAVANFACVARELGDLFSGREFVTTLRARRGTSARVGQGQTIAPRGSRGPSEICR